MAIKLPPFLRALITFFIVLTILYFVVYKTGEKWSSESAFGVEGKIAVVRIEGVISDSKSAVKQLKKYGSDNSIKGILLRINTPGGGVAASQEIYSEVLRVKAYKKVVVSMGALAASGGYYIACAADTIFANPGTLTGSIGVIMAFSNMEELFRKIGLKTTVIKSGRHKDVGSPAREITEEEREMLQTVSDDIHYQFINAVASGRKMDIKTASSLSDGRIFSGRQAKEVGLVDKLGTQEDAIRELAMIVGIEGSPKIVEDKKDKNLLLKFITGELYDLITLKSDVRHYYEGVYYLWRGR